MKQISVRMLKQIARQARQDVGTVNTEAAFLEAVAVAVSRMVEEAKQAGVPNAEEIAEQVRESMKALPGDLPPGRKFRVFRDTIAPALVNAAPDVSLPDDEESATTVKTGTRNELRVFAQMLQDGLDVYVPLADDHGVDAVVRWKNGPVLRVQVKSREKSARGNYAKFRIRPIPQDREGLFFVFCSEQTGQKWLMSANEFVSETNGQQSIDFLGNHQGVSEKYMVQNFQRLKEET